MTPLLANESSSTSSVGAAITEAVVSIVVSVANVDGLLGQFQLSPLLTAVAATYSMVAFTALVLAAVLFLGRTRFEQHTLGAFLMGMVVDEKTKSTNKSSSVQKSSLSSSKHVESTIQGILMAIFFLTLALKSMSILSC
jgi:hypothetical protein